MYSAIKQNEEDRLTNGNPPTLNVPLDAYVAADPFLLSQPVLCE